MGALGRDVVAHAGELGFEIGGGRQRPSARSASALAAVASSRLVESRVRASPARKAAPPGD